MINIMDEICPENQKLESKTKRDADISEYNQCDDLGDNYESILNGIRNLIRKMEKEEKPEFLIDGIIPIFNLSATDLKKLSSITSINDVAVLPKETQKIIFRVFTVLSKEGISLKGLFGCISEIVQKRSSWKKLLAHCGSQDISVTCKDTSKDFCANGKTGFGSMVILAIFIPGLIQAIGNIIHYRVSI